MSNSHAWFFFVMIFLSLERNTRNSRMEGYKATNPPPAAAAW
jgi:hypothetical protein